MKRKIRQNQDDEKDNLKAEILKVNKEKSAFMWIRIVKRSYLKNNEDRMIKEVESQWKIQLTRKQVSNILKQILIFSFKTTDPKAWVSLLPILSSIRKIDGFYRFNHFNRRNNHKNGSSSWIWVESQRQT